MFRIVFAALMFAALLGAGPAPAQSGHGASESPAVRQPTWAATPSPEELERAYPKAALARGASGRTKIQCNVLPDGRLANCDVIEETPPGMGFGQASLAAARSFRMTPYDPASVAQTPRVIIPITWRIDPHAQAEAQTRSRLASDVLPPWLAAAFPVVFVVLWFSVATILGVMSGWYALMERFPDRNAPALVTLRSQSGRMGAVGVSLRGILTLTACASGLRVSIWRIFGPFSRPFFVPWGEIRPEPATFFFQDMVRLRFGNPEVGVLTIYAPAWARLSENGARTSSTRMSALSAGEENGKLLRSAVLQWIVVTAFASAFFYYAPPLLGGDHVPPEICVGFPAVVIGVGQLIRYLSQRRWR